LRAFSFHFLLRPFSTDPFLRVLSLLFVGPFLVFFSLLFYPWGFTTFTNGLVPSVESPIEAVALTPCIGSPLYVRPFRFVGPSILGSVTYPLFRLSTASTPPKVFPPPQDLRFFFGLPSLTRARFTTSFKLRLTLGSTFLVFPYSWKKPPYLVSPLCRIRKSLLLPPSPLGRT